MLGHFSSGYPKGFDMPEDKESLSKRVSRFLLSLLNPLLENRHLHFELVDLVFEKDDFLVFGVGVHGHKAFEASLTDSSRESGGQNGRFDDQRNSIADDVQVLIHTAVQTSSRT